MLSHSELAVLAARSYCGPQSGHVALDVRYDLIPREGEVIVVMPGTHPADALDWLRDLRAWPAVVGPIGPVHSGFGKGAAALWPELERDLPPYGLITYTGHSLGGALAQGLAAIHAQRWRDVRFRVVTFGAPRIGFLNPWFGRLARSGLEAAEYQRTGDIVPDVPLRPLYRHPTRPTAIGASVGDFVKNHAIARYAADLAALNL